MRILIDLTDIEKWSGAHGGIQRVVYGVSKYFYLNNEADYEIGFISYSSERDIFYKAEFKPIYDRVERKYEVSPQDDFSVDTKVSVRHRIRMGIRENVPESVRKNRYARKAFKSSISVAKKTVKKMKATTSNETEVYDNRVEFTQNDVVLVLGKPWDDLAIQNRLTLEKEKAEFKLVQVVYDLIICLYPHLHHPSLFEPYTKHMFEAIDASDLLLPISKSSDRDLKKLCKILNLECPSTKVIRLGDNVIDDSKILKSIKKPDIRIENKFLLCVGTVEIRKNHNLIYYTYKLAEERGINLPQLVIVGGKGWLSEDTQYLINNDPGLKNKIIILHGLNDKDLSWLYSNCMFTVYPSMYEGWGLPIAESLAYNKLCVSSNTSSMQEIAGDLIEYFSPYSAEECLQSILKYLDKDILMDAEDNIAKRYEITTWENTYKQVEKAIIKL